MLDPTGLGPDGTSVYLYYDTHDVLIYVGVTSRGMQRQREHNADKDWWPLVANQMVEHYPTRARALARETELVKRYQPPYNTAQNVHHKRSRRVYQDSLAMLHEIDPLKRLSILGGQVPLHISRRDGQIVTLVAGTRFVGITNKIDYAESRPQVMGWQLECGKLLEVAKHPFATVIQVELNNDVNLMTHPYARVHTSKNRFYCRYIKVQMTD